MRTPREPHARRRVHTFSYYLSSKDTQRHLKVHQRRDTGAAAELQWALADMGFGQGEPLLDFPPEPYPEQPPPAHELHPVDLTSVQHGDVILQTTRTPLNDLDHGDRKRVKPGFTVLGSRLQRFWPRYLEICSRSHVKLAERGRASVRPGFESRREMSFHEAQCAPYKELNAHDGSGWRPAPTPARTALFLLHVEEIWEGGPGLIGAFGMDGTSTLIWAYRLSRDLRELLVEPCFLVAEMELPRIPKRPTDLRWAARLPIEIVVRHEP